MLLFYINIEYLLVYSGGKFSKLPKEEYRISIIYYNSEDMLNNTNVGGTKYGCIW